MKALVVDDDLITRMILEDLLSAYGEVHACGDGDEAVPAFRNALQTGAPFDLVCLDVMMTRMGGIEALSLIRREEELHAGTQLQPAKVIMTTATDDRETINQAFRGLCDAYVIKPIDAGELVDILHCLFPVQTMA